MTEMASRNTSAAGDAPRAFERPTAPAMQTRALHAYFGATHAVRDVTLEVGGRADSIRLDDCTPAARKRRQTTGVALRSRDRSLRACFHRYRGHRVHAEIQHGG